jgi:hypothetical protein
VKLLDFGWTFGKELRRIAANKLFKSQPHHRAAAAKFFKCSAAVDRP